MPLETPAVRATGKTRETSKTIIIRGVTTIITAATVPGSLSKDASPASEVAVPITTTTNAVIVRARTTTGTAIKDVLSVPVSTQFQAMWATRPKQKAKTSTGRKNHPGATTDITTRTSPITAAAPAMTPMPSTT